MAAKTKTEMLARLDIWLDDADDFAFTDAQKAEGYNSVVNDDPYVYKIVTDTTLTTAANTPTYTPATAYDGILRISIDVNGDGYPIPVDRSAWDYVDGTIRFNYLYKGLPASKTIHLKAKKKLDADTDSIPTNLQGYVLHRATANMLGILTSRKTGRFLRNDTTMGEILQKKSDHEAHAAQLAKRLSNRHDIVL
jgi:hypothetical protein